MSRPAFAHPHPGFPSAAAVVAALAAVALDAGCDDREAPAGLGTVAARLSGEGLPAGVDDATEESLQRRPADRDTGDNAADFFVLPPTACATP